MVVKDGSKVSINYTLKVDGEVVDSSSKRGPLQYTQGAKEIIPGLEKELAGLKAGDRKNVTVSAAEGYGEHNPNAMQKVERKMFKDADKLQKGSVVGGEVNGQQFQAMVADIDGEYVTLDFNHPLAGKTLDFEIEVVDVQ